MLAEFLKGVLSAIVVVFSVSLFLLLTTPLYEDNSANRPSSEELKKYDLISLEELEAEHKFILSKHRDVKKKLTKANAIEKIVQKIASDSNVVSLISALFVFVVLYKRPLMIAGSFSCIAVISIAMGEFFVPVFIAFILFVYLSVLKKLNSR